MLGNIIKTCFTQTAFFNLTGGNLVMILIACVFLFLAIKKALSRFCWFRSPSVCAGQYLSGYHGGTVRGCTGGRARSRSSALFFISLTNGAFCPSLILWGVGAMTDFAADREPQEFHYRERQLR